MWLALSIGGAGWVASLWLAGVIGYKLRDIRDTLVSMKQDLKTRTVKPEPTMKKESTSSLIDPADLTQRAQWESDQIIKKLNT